MSNKSSSTSGGIGLGGAVFLVFLVLKLTGHIDWSWWWVTSPIWGVFALAALIMLVAVTLAVVGAMLQGGSARRRR